MKLHACCPRNHKLSIVCSLVLSLVLGVSSSQAQNAPHVYVVDMQRILDESIVGKAAQASLKADAEKREAKLGLMRKDVLKGREDLEKQSTLLSPQAVQEKREAQMKKERELERAIADEREALSMKSDEAIRKIVRDAQAQVQVVARQDNLPFVVVRDENFVVYVNSKFDITERVLKALDEKAVG